MKKEKIKIRKINVSIFLCFIIYIMVLLYITLLGRLSEQTNMVSVCPLWSYVEIIKEGNQKLACQIFYNILAFIPLGFFLPFLVRQMQYIWKVILCGFLFSTIIEFVQYLFHLGWCDIDDIINNTMGVALGYGIWYIGRKLLRNFLMCQ